MFADAYRKAEKFTFPLIISVHYLSGKTECSIGSFVVLNAEGWIATASHLFETQNLFDQTRKQYSQVRAAITRAESDSSLTPAEKQMEIDKIISAHPKLATHISYWWNWDSVEASEVFHLHEADLAIAKLRNFNPDLISGYPILKNSDDLVPGTSLCRLGFPFHRATSVFDDATQSFRIVSGIPAPLFPIEGIFTRVLNFGSSADGQYEIKMIETSSPGLRGQSGGPIFDRHGNLWGIQSHTKHLALGFSPEVNVDGQLIKEHQFLHVGVGTHPSLLQSFLAQKGVAFKQE
jgi:hypothetical protein